MTDWQPYQLTFLPPSICFKHMRHPLAADSDILASNARRARQSTIRLDRVALLHIQDRGTSNALRGTVGDVRRTSKANTPKVRERHQRAPALKVLNNPLGISLAQGPERALVAERVADALARGQVLDCGRAGREAGGFDGRADAVAGLDGEAGEGVAVVGVPFVPGFVGGFGAFDEELDAGLEDGWGCVSVVLRLLLHGKRGLTRATSIAINSNPSTRAILLVGTATRRLLHSRDSERALHLRDAAANDDCAGPVAAVLDLVGVGLDDDGLLEVGGVDRKRAIVLAAFKALGEALLATLLHLGGCGEGGACEQEGGREDCGGLHGCWLLFALAGNECGKRGYVSKRLDCKCC